MGASSAFAATHFTPAAVGTYVILKIVQAVVGLRPAEHDEIEGLDLVMQGEQAYHEG